VKKMDIGKSALFMNPTHSLLTCPKLLKLCQITLFDIGSQKTTLEAKLEEVSLKFRHKIYNIFPESLGKSDFFQK
jgi:hypothetical protein